MENWYRCYLFSIWSGNVTLFEDDGQVVYVCVCACMHVWVCIQRVNRCAGDVRRQSDWEREKNVFLSLFLFLSLSFSPSWGTGFESECIVKQIDCFFWRLRRRATCRLLRNQTFKKHFRPAVFPNFKSCLSQQGFEIHPICSSQIGILTFYWAASYSGAFLPPNFHVFFFCVCFF